MLVHRVLTRGIPRWMISTTPFTTKDTTQKLSLMKNETLFETEPSLWAAKPQISEEQVEVHYSQLLPPIPKLPPFVYGLGLNYLSHSEETKMPLPKYPIVIGKSPTALIGPCTTIQVPKVCREAEVDYEVELAIVIGKKCRNVSKFEAMDYILGFSCANDVSARRWQGKKGGGQWVRAKSFDTFLPFGPSLAINGFINPKKANLRSWLQKGGTNNRMLMQDANTSDLISDVTSIVEFLSQDTTLLPWTLILTGTPSGVGYTRTPPVYLEDGDEVEIEVEGIGHLWNPVSNAT